MAYCGPKGIPLSVFLSWDEADQDAALQWQEYEAARCPGCGTHLDDWTDDPHAWVAEPHRCKGCQAVESSHEKLQNTPNRGHGVRVRLRRRRLGEVVQSWLIRT